MEFPINLHSSFLISVFKPFSILGGVMGSILVLALLYWLVDHRVAVKLATALVFSNVLNSLLKFMIHQPRPSGLRYDDVNGSGMPSGHAQSSVVMYGLLGIYYRQYKWVIGLSVLLPLLIGISRVVLNVHTLGQVIVGWVLGLFLAIGFYYFYEHILELKKHQLSKSMSVVLAGTVLLILTLLVFFFHESPETLHDLLVTLSALAGLWLGYLLLVTYLDFSAPTSFLAGVIRTLIGLFLLVIVLFGVKSLLHPLGEFGSSLTYFLVGLTTSFIIPWVFELIPLTRSSP